MVWPRWSTTSATKRRSTNLAGKASSIHFNTILSFDLWQTLQSCELYSFIPRRSKIFIRFPKTLFLTEDALQAKKPEIGKWQWNVSHTNPKQDHVTRLIQEELLLCSSFDSADILARLHGESQIQTYQTCKSVRVTFVLTLACYMIWASLFLWMTAENAFVCMHSHSDPVRMARDERTPEGKEASNGCWVDSQVPQLSLVAL